MAETEDYSKSATPTAHKTSHQDGGSDEISVEGLAGDLADPQESTWARVSGKPTTFAPEAHKTSHQDGGSDEISVQGLAGLLADAQAPLAHKTSHQDLGSDEISVQGLSGLLADPQTPLAHKTSHEPSGSDELTAFIKHALATAANDFLVASGTGVFVKKTLAETQAILAAFKTTYTTKDLSNADNFSITGIGFQPSAVIMLAEINNTVCASFGFADTTGAGVCFYMLLTSLWANYAEGVGVIQNPTADDFAIIKVVSYNSDGITFSNTKVGSPTGTAYMLFLCIR